MDRSSFVLCAGVVVLAASFAAAQDDAKRLGAFNPAIGVALDGVFHDSNDQAAFEFRAAELSLEAPIDPSLKGWAILTARSGSGAEVEEAAMETTALSHGLTVRGGRLFASFGRMGHFHDHELPVVDRPTSLDSYIGGETQADGLEASWLAPTEFYLNAVCGVYNKLGGENLRQDNAGSRPLDEFTYLGRLSAYADVTDSQSFELGASAAWTPKRSVTEDVAVTGSAEARTARGNTWRTLSGFDMTYRYQPAQAGPYRGLVWGTEVFENRERRFHPLTRLPTDRVRAYGGYSYIEVKSGRRWRGGIMIDLSEDLDNPHQLTKTLTGFASFDATEFQRLRLSCAESVVNVPGRPKNHTVALQWTGILGHHVHGFRDR